jgi:hypothetical protein
MAYGIPGITFADSAAVDSFGRLRVSEPYSLVSTKAVGNTPELLCSNAVTGSGVATYTVNRSSTYLTVGTAVGTATRQTKIRGIYQPGKSQFAKATFIMAPGQANLVQQVGYFDTNDGVFLQLSGTTLAVVLRSSVSGSPVDTAVAQNTWNIDKFDGTGPSGLTLDITKPQILAVDLQWLGVGRVRVGFVINGTFYYAHQFQGSNGSFTSVYMKNPNLPIRWFIQATGTVTGTPQLEAICGDVASEGGVDNTFGNFSSADNAGTGISVANGAWAELLAIRLQSSFTSFSSIFLQQLTISTDVAKNATGSALYRVVLNPSGVTGGAWSSLTNSVCEKNTTRTGATGAANASGPAGIILDAGYFGPEAVADISKAAIPLGIDLAGNLDVYSLQVLNISLGTTNFYGTLTWRELD